MALFQRNQIGFKQTSVSTTVPNNDVARLMYYFHCVCSAIEYNDSDVSRYRNYQNYASLTYNEIRCLLVLCLTLSPDEFDDKVFFQSDALCGDSFNRFYEISQVSHQLLAVQSIVIAGQICHVNKIMTYKMSWMHENYFNPIQRLAPRYNINTLQSSACVIS
jgi:hypothetical protein